MKKTLFILCIAFVCLFVSVSCQATNTAVKSAGFDHSGEFVNPEGTYICKTPAGYVYLILDPQTGKAIYNGRSLDYTREGSLLSFKSGERQYFLEICNVDSEHHELVRVSRGVLVRFYPLGYFLEHFPSEPRFFNYPATSAWNRQDKTQSKTDNPIQKPVKPVEPVKADKAVQTQQVKPVEPKTEKVRQSSVTDIPKTVIIPEEKKESGVSTPQGQAQYKFEKHQYVNDGTGWKEVPSDQGSSEQHMYVFDGNTWKEIPVNN